MGRSRKPYKVKDVHDPHTNRRVEMFLDRNTNPHVFFGVVNAVRVEAETERECESLILSKLKIVDGLKWVQKIVVQVDSGGHWNKDVLMLRFSRHEVADAGDKWLERDFRSGEHVHPAMLEMRLNGNDIKPHRGLTVSDPKNGVFVLEYSEQLWQDLGAIYAAIQELKRRLRELLGDPDKIRRLVASMPKLLVAPEGEDG